MVSEQIWYPPWGIFPLHFSRENPIFSSFIFHYIFCYPLPRKWFSRFLIIILSPPLILFPFRSFFFPSSLVQVGFNFIFKSASSYLSFYIDQFHSQNFGSPIDLFRRFIISLDFVVDWVLDLISLIFVCRLTIAWLCFIAILFLPISRVPKFQDR
jgi:hypothetical protein